MQILVELQIPTTEDLLTKPTLEKMRPVYKEFVEILAGVRKEDLEQPQFEAMEALSNPELHEESIAELSFNRALQKLMAAVGVADFAMRDVYKPEVKRSIRNLSAIINFAKFREERMEKYQDLSQESEQLAETHQQMQGEHEELKAQLLALRAKHAEEEPYMQELGKETEALSGEINGLNKRQAGFNNEIKELKAVSNEYNDKIANDRFLILGAKQDCSKLKSQIVQSPEKIKKQLSDMSKSVENERSSVTHQEATMKDLQQRLDSLQKVEKDVKKNLALMDSLDVETSKVKTAKHQLKDATDTIAENQEELRELGNRENMLTRQLGQLKEKTDRVSRDGERALQEAQTRLNAKQQERGMLERTKTSNQARLDQNDALSREMKENIERLRKEHDAEVVGMQALCSRLESQVNNYHASLSASMAA